LVYNVITVKTIFIGRIEVRNKKILSILLLICLVLSVAFLLFSTGCAQRGTIEPDYSAAVAEKFLIGFDKNDYDSISAYLSEEFKGLVKQFKVPGTTDKTYATLSEAFSAMIALKVKDANGKPLYMKDKIGVYQAGTLKFDRTLSEKGYTSVFYKAKYSNEPNGDVTIQLVFKDENGKMLISGFWFNSKILAK
jgi:hypothetical protein